MVCIFGFGLHDWFCPCELVDKQHSDLEDVLCSDCKEVFWTEYLEFLKDEKINWDGDFEDFLYVHIESRLNVLDMQMEDLHDCNLTDWEYENVFLKFYRMYGRFMDRETERIEGKVASEKTYPENIIN
jgi:hypothetical protein